MKDIKIKSKASLDAYIAIKESCAERVHEIFAGSSKFTEEHIRKRMKQYGCDVHEFYYDETDNDIGALVSCSLLIDESVMRGVTKPFYLSIIIEAIFDKETKTTVESIFYEVKSTNKAINSVELLKL